MAERRLIANHLVPDGEVWVSPRTWDEPFSNYTKEALNTDAQQLNDAIANHIIDALIKDISDRRGIKWEWKKIDADVVDEIRATWKAILQQQH